MFLRRILKTASYFFLSAVAFVLSPLSIGRGSSTQQGDVPYIPFANADTPQGGDGWEGSVSGDSGDTTGCVDSGGSCGTSGGCAGSSDSGGGAGCGTSAGGDGDG